MGLGSMTQKSEDGMWWIRWLINIIRSLTSAM